MAGLYIVSLLGIRDESFCWGRVVQQSAATTTHDRISYSRPDPWKAPDEAKRLFNGISERTVAKALLQAAFRLMSEIVNHRIDKILECRCVP